VRQSGGGVAHDQVVVDWTAIPGPSRSLDDLAGRIFPDEARALIDDRDDVVVPLRFGGAGDYVGKECAEGIAEGRARRRKKRST